MGHNGNVSVAMYVLTMYVGEVFTTACSCRLQITGGKRPTSQKERKNIPGSYIVTTALTLQPAQFLAPFASTLFPPFNSIPMGSGADHWSNRRNRGATHLCEARSGGYRGHQGPGFRDSAKITG